MPSTTNPEDREPTFSEFVADRVMEVIALDGRSIREVGRVAGIPNSRLLGRLHSDRPLNTDELARLASALGVNPVAFVAGWQA